MHFKSLAAVVSIALTLGVQAAPSTFDRAAGVNDLLKRSHSHGVDMNQVSKRATTLVAKKRELNRQRRDGKGCRQRPKTPSTNPGSSPTQPATQAPKQDAAKQEPHQEEPVKEAPVKEAPVPQPTTTTTQEPAKETPKPANDNTGNGATAPNDLAQQWLDAHNAARAQHGASPLTWSDELANYAQDYGNHCKFEHSKNNNYGENLAAQTTSMTPAQAVGMWMSEVDEYDPSNPQYSHFTQVVWKGSTSLGCAMITCAAGTIFDQVSIYGICEYNPPGNVIGQFAENVQK